MDITINSLENIFIFDHILRDLLGSAISGVSVGDNTRIHLQDESQATIDIVNSFVAGHGMLPVTATDEDILIGGTSDITSVTPEPDAGYFVLLDGQVFADGDCTVSAGVATITLNPAVDGIYDIVVFERSGLYRSGGGAILVSEA